MFNILGQDRRKPKSRCFSLHRREGPAHGSCRSTCRFPATSLVPPQIELNTNYIKSVSNNKSGRSFSRLLPPHNQWILYKSNWLLWEKWQSTISCHGPSDLLQCILYSFLSYRGHGLQRNPWFRWEKIIELIMIFEICGLTEAPAWAPPSVLFLFHVLLLLLHI